MLARKWARARVARSTPGIKKSSNRGGRGGRGARERERERSVPSGHKSTAAAPPTDGNRRPEDSRDRRQMSSLLHRLRHATNDSTVGHAARLALEMKSMPANERTPIRTRKSDYALIRRRRTHTMGSCTARIWVDTLSSSPDNNKQTYSRRW